jgi:hypothetical protein
MTGTCQKPLRAAETHLPTMTFKEYNQLDVNLETCVALCTHGVV